MAENTYDTIIVGGGMAGLTAAAYLSRARQKVLLVEKNRECGGLVNSFVRDGFHFDAGVRALEDAGIVFPLLRDLGGGLMKPNAMTPATVPTRRAFSERMAEYGAIDGDFVVFEADIGYSTFSHLFGDKYPERYFNMGIAEGNMVIAAAGMAPTAAPPWHRATAFSSP